MPVQRAIREIPTVRGYYETWIARQVAPVVRKSTAIRHRLAFDSILLPLLTGVRLDEITPAFLLDLRAQLIRAALARSHPAARIAARISRRRRSAGSIRAARGRAALTGH
ncbi:MAG: hypothetical protein QOD06_1450 [Candidatus Binatota bacterium]|nr:hypothetical protein [Candidatus Binatota bacterium]